MVLFIGLIVLGLVLIFIEAFVPGGVIGVLGILCFVAAIAVGYTQFETETANLVMGITVASLVVGGFLWLKYFPTSRLGQRLSSNHTIGHQGHDHSALLGKEGTAITPLRTSGTAEIDGKRWDVITEGSFVEKGDGIVVHDVQGNKIVVRPVA